MKRVDHAEASSVFLRSKQHLEFHDRRLWDLRQKRDREAAAIPEWEELRALASQIKEHTLANLGRYLEAFEANALANGMHVHWARDAAEHNQVVYELLGARGARVLVKSKTKLTDECEMRPFLEGRGIEVVETDLGERIQQLDGEPPSHIVVPAVHKLATDVARVADTEARRLYAEFADDPRTHRARACTRRPAHRGSCRRRAHTRPPGERIAPDSACRRRHPLCRPMTPGAHSSRGCVRLRR